MRMLKVRGVPGVNVSNPHTVSQRFVGKETKADGSFADCEVVIADHPDLRYALKHGDLKACDADTARIAGIDFKPEKAPKVSQ